MADGCYIGGSFPDAVWSHCFAPPGGATRAGRLDVEANVVVATVDLGAAGSLIGVTDQFSYFLVVGTADLPARLVAIDNATNGVYGVYAFDAPEPPFDMAAVLGESLWYIDVEDGELRTLALSELAYEDQAIR
jgi:hypothetical protein